MRNSILLRVATAAMVVGSSGVLLFAQVGTVSGGGPVIATPEVSIVNPQTRVLHTAFCGGVTQQGSPIAGNASGGGTSGSITILGIPATATVRKATLYWTVLTNDAEASNTGGSIMFDGNGVTGTKIGTRNATPCFPQVNTIAWKADVTVLVSSPGNGTYSVSGFPGGNAIGGDNFAEGATLQILWTDPSAPLRDIAVYETPAGAGGLAVTNGIGDTFTQALAFNINASGPVSGTLYEVIGNGQSTAETFSVSGPGGTINLDDTLDGSTSEIAADGCSYTDSGLTACFWDDDTPDITGALTNTATSVSMNYTLTNDCHDFPADTLSVSTDADGVCLTGGQFVDAQCPADDVYNNHGDYVSCVAHAAEQFLASLGCGSAFPFEETQSCIVNPRARSSVGK
jgi:hypothetical protein